MKPLREGDAAVGEVDVGESAVRGVHGSLGKAQLFHRIRNTGDGGGGDSKICSQFTETEIVLSVDVKIGHRMQRTHGDLA